MQKLYILLLLSLMSFTGVMFSMEQGEMGEQKGGRVPMLQQLALKKIVQEMDVESKELETYPKEIQRLVQEETMEEILNKSPKDLKRNEYRDYLDRAISRAMKLKNNDYAVKLIKKWLKGIGNEQEQQGFLERYMTSLITDRPHAEDKIIFLIKKIMRTNVNVVFDHGYTPLTLAAKHGRNKNIEYLLDNGADINAADKHGMPPLGYAVKELHSDTVKYLVNRGANVDIDTGGFGTLLTMAAGNDLNRYVKEEVVEDIVRYLIEHGVDVNAVNEYGATARELAQKYGYENIVAILDEAAEKKAKYETKEKKVDVLDQAAKEFKGKSTTFTQQRFFKQMKLSPEKTALIGLALGGLACWGLYQISSVGLTSKS